jgi:hypothetical protein
MIGFSPDDMRGLFDPIVEPGLGDSFGKCFVKFMSDHGGRDNEQGDVFVGFLRGRNVSFSRIIESDGRPPSCRRKFIVPLRWIRQFFDDI